MKSLYFIALMVPPQLSEQIDEIRKECAERFKVKAAVKQGVHLTLYRPFFLEEDREAHLIKLLLPATENLPFEQELENFDSFHMHAVYIRALKNGHLLTLRKNISAIISRNKLDVKEVKGNTLFNPHITIAYRDIPAEVFPEMWQEYKDRRFKRSFRAEAFTLLKHDGKKWNNLRDFPLKQVETLKLF